MLRFTRRFSAEKAAALAVGDVVPNAQVFVNVPPQAVPTTELFAGKKVFVMTVPGAFTGTCNSQLPLFQEAAQEIHAKFGTTEIFCVTTNDSFVMQAWAKSLNIDPSTIQMVSDPNQNLLKAFGHHVNLPVLGGNRYGRLCCVINDRKIEKLWEESEAKLLQCTRPEVFLREQ